MRKYLFNKIIAYNVKRKTNLMLDFRSKLIIVCETNTCFSSV